MTLPALTIAESSSVYLTSAEVFLTSKLDVYTDIVTKNWHFVTERYQVSENGMRVSTLKRNNEIRKITVKRELRQFWLFIKVKSILPSLWNKQTDKRQTQSDSILLFYAHLKRNCQYQFSSSTSLLSGCRTGDTPRHWFDTLAPLVKYLSLLVWQKSVLSKVWYPVRHIKLLTCYKLEYKSPHLLCKGSQVQKGRWIIKAMFA